MFPELFRIGPVAIYSYGAMLATGFIIGAWLLRIELRRWNLKEEISDHIAVAGMIGGIVGSKLYFVLLEAPDRLAAAPFETLFSGAGLTFYGGLIGAFLLIYLVIRYHKVSVVQMLDFLGMIIIMGYGFGRVGCFLSGDGDYGPPSSLLMNGTYDPPLQILTDSTAVGTLPSALIQATVAADLPWTMSFPKGTVPCTVPVHPTMVYEFVTMFIIFAFTWFWLRKKNPPRGFLIGFSLFMMGIERLVTEFWRLDSGVLASGGYSVSGATTLLELESFSRAVQAHYAYGGFSLAQWISVALMILGGVIVFLVRNKPKAIPPDRAGFAPEAG